jgi:hypothetical protein
MSEIHVKNVVYGCVTLDNDCDNVTKKKVSNIVGFRHAHHIAMVVGGSLSQYDLGICFS